MVKEAAPVRLDLAFSMVSSRLSPRFEVSQTHGRDVRVMHRIPVQLRSVRLTCCVFVSGMAWKDGND